MFNMKGFTVFILLLVSGVCYGQYDGIDGKSSGSNGGSKKDKTEDIQSDSMLDDYETRPSILDNLTLYKGLEFMTNGSQNFLYLAFDPQIGANLNDRLFLGGGAHLGLNNFMGSAGVFGFARISINQIFFQTEYRAVNVFENQTQKRGWVSSPIFLVGYATDNQMSGWTSVGIAINSNYSRNMPFGALVYRIGIQF